MTEAALVQSYVTFFRPGDLTPAMWSEIVETWDVEAALALARKIEGQRPFAFQFSTIDHTGGERLNKSPMHYLGGRVETLADIEARNDPCEAAMLEALKRMGPAACTITYAAGLDWMRTQPLHPADVVLEFA